jgi:bacterioferritin (cytochrome b1)
METRERDEAMEAEEFNRTGIMTNPELSAELIEGARQTTPSSDGDADALAELRSQYLQERLPIGSPPMVAEVSEDGEILGPLEGMTILLDKLGERLAFERQGTRLYETVIQKCQLLEPEDGSGPSLEELRHICDEELEHFRMLQKAITDLGGDATAKTPCADIAGVMSKGVLEVAVDPRTTIPQTLQALLTAELVDNDGWQMLQDLAAELGQDDLEEQCRQAFEQEQEHLEKVRDWLTTMTMDEVTGSLEDDDSAAQDEDERKEKEPPKRETKSHKPRSSSGAAKSKSKKKKKSS